MHFLVDNYVIIKYASREKMKNYCILVNKNLQIENLARRFSFLKTCFLTFRPVYQVCNYLV